MIPVSMPFVAPKQKEYVNDCLDRNWISAFGKYDRLLCEGFSSFIGTKYASTCSNGTAALHLALLAAGVISEDEVILPDFHAPYALFAVGYIGAKPVLVDVDKNWDISVSSLKKATGMSFDTESINFDFALIRIPFNPPAPLTSRIILGYFSISFTKAG